MKTDLKRLSRLFLMDYGCTYVQKKVFASEITVALQKNKVLGTYQSRPTAVKVTRVSHVVWLLCKKLTGAGIKSICYILLLHWSFSFMQENLKCDNCTNTRLDHDEKKKCFCTTRDQRSLTVFLLCAFF